MSQFSRTPILRACLILLLAAYVMTTGQGVLSAKMPGKKGGEKDAQKQKAPRVFSLEEGIADDVVLPFVPATPRTPVDQKEIDSAAWYMTGRMREARNDFIGAYDAYKKAMEYNPNSIEIYRVLIRLASGLDKTEEAIEYAQKAVELDPEDYELMRKLGLHMAGQGRFEEAVTFLKKASDSPSIDKKSGVYVIIQHDQANLYERLGKKEEAAQCWEVVFRALTKPEEFTFEYNTRSQLEAKQGKLYERIGQSFLETDRLKLAVDAFNKAADSQKGRPGILKYHLAQVYFQSKQYQQALDSLQSYFDEQLQSKGRRAYEFLTEILTALNRQADVIPQLEKLAEKDRFNRTLHYYLAEQYGENDRFDDAEKTYLESIGESSDTEGLAGLLSLYQKNQKYAKLIETLSKIVQTGDGVQRIQSNLERMSKDPELVKGLIAEAEKLKKQDPPGVDVFSAFMIAKLASEADRKAAASEFYQFAMDAAAKHEKPQIRGNWTLLILQEYSQLLREEDKYGELAVLLQKAVENPLLAPQRINLLYFLADARERNGETEAAIKVNEEARQAAPKFPLLDYQHAWIYYHSHDWEKAIVQMQKFIKKYPEQKERVYQVKMMLSNTYVQQGEIGKGEAVLEEMLADDPENPSINNDLGYLYADQGKNLEKAEKMIRIALKSEPDNMAYLDSMGWVLFKLERYQEAAEYLEKASKLPGGGDSTILDHLADCYHKLNKTKEANELWKKALEEAQQSSPADPKLIDQLQKKLNQ
ncbi:tetratricopeptide repeat protein [Gimesia maris]|uniref:Tetratricopeptide repeat protein n=1 Tax=Gimesia maris TaxID=122 RepID=A0ABX5YID8_9PLAN|nr:tetratricopeptide repeat protein [Gimesia maris]EDL56706.1 Tetratricopeptide repeat protein [Gimesia maris DSM 8797]QDU13472.1 tetratricopeptide repeat protein [Gimesia maris]QEG15400.1 tetratricopeptide repeat protein [Gimesia maris]QGQ31282.1 tetratricopeptide repeat protein [Gimesia maris]